MIVSHCNSITTALLAVHKYAFGAMSGSGSCAKAFAESPIHVFIRSTICFCTLLHSSFIVVLLPFVQDELVVRRCGKEMTVSFVNTKA